jgi:hypothetical protein
VLLWKAFGPTLDGGGRMPAEYFQRLGVVEPPQEGDYFIALNTFLKNHYNLGDEERDAMEQRLWVIVKGPWTAQDHPFLAAWLKANEKPLAVVVEATRRPEYFSPVVSRRTGEELSSIMAALLPNVQKCREVTTAFILRSTLRIGEGNSDAAWQDLLACHRLARLLSRGTLIEVLVGIAIDSITCNADLTYLERTPLTSPQVRDRLKELQGLMPFTPLADKIDVAERLGYLETMQNTRRNGTGTLEMMAGMQGVKVNPLEAKALEHLDWDAALRGGNRWFDRLVAALRLPDRAAREKELDRIKTELQALKQAVAVRTNQGPLVPGVQLDKTLATAFSNIALALVMPGLHKVQTASERAAQMERNLHVAFALTAYHRDQGRYPAKLDDLAPRYLATIPNDIFAGKPLVYRLEGNGYLLYSVGINGRDEEGRTQGDEPVGGDDVRVRMPLPEVKRE